LREPVKGSRTPQNRLVKPVVKLVSAYALSHSEVVSQCLKKLTAF